MSGSSHRFHPHNNVGQQRAEMVAGMVQNITQPLASATACDACGQHRPHPRLPRALTKLSAVFPIELLLHALVLRYDLGYLASVAILSASTTVLVIWVVEPSARRVLRTWLRGRARRTRRRLDAAPELWRVRTVVDNAPGALERVLQGITSLHATVLGLHLHPLERGTLAEVLVSANGNLREEDLVAPVTQRGGRNAMAWPTTVLSLVDGQTRALSLATRVARDPAELPLAVAELLHADLVTDRLSAIDPRGSWGDEDPTVLRVPSPWTGMFALRRTSAPFTPAEVARAHRLAELAQVSAAGTTDGHRGLPAVGSIEVPRSTDSRRTCYGT